jgi:outer membrane receptor for ferrienterochelin and colicin
VHIRLLIILLLTAATCHGQSLLKTPVTPSRQNGTAGEFLNELNRVPGVTISYSSAIVDLKRNIKLSGQEKTVEDVLKIICNNQPIKYVEQNGKIFLVTTQPSKKKYTVSGYISDKQSGERLIGASIYLPGRNIGTTSNIYGFYSLTLELDTIPLQVSYAGYHTWTAQFMMQSDYTMNIELEKNIVMNEMVTVQATRSQTPERTLTGKTDINAAFVKSVPSLFGEADVLKTLQLLPGIQAGNEGTSGLNVRGGSPDQNLVLLDGVPVYNASHAFGLFSIFNADAVNNVEVLKSGFPSSYGGRLSSVVDVHLKEGDKYNFHGEGGIGLIFSRLTLEGPLKKGRSSFLVSARRTYVDAFAIPIQAIAKGQQRVYPHFTDLNVKANFPTGQKDRIYFSLYTGKDRLRVRDQYLEKIYAEKDYTSNNVLAWGNSTAMMRWNHVFNKKMFSNFTFTYSRYRFDVKNETEKKETQPSYYYHTKSTYFSSIRDWSVKADFDYLPAPDHFIKAGISGTMHKYWPGIIDVYENDNNEINETHIEQPILTSGEYDAYIEDDIRLSDKMKTNIGVRFSAFQVRDELFTSWQPRINWLYNLSKGWSIKASYSKMAQFIHLLTNSGVGLPTDLWLPVTPKVPPQSSSQVSAGASWAYDKSLTLSMELYYKSLKNVIDFNEESVFFNAYDNWEELVTTGTGKAYGIEWMFRKKKGKVTGLGSYTLSRSTRQFAAINEGRSFPFKYDRRHEIKMAVIWEKSKRFEASAAWYFSTGYAISLPEAQYYDPNAGPDNGGGIIDVYGSRNSFRMPNYHRLDLSVKFMKQKKKYLRSWVLSVYNVYNRFNPFYLEATDSPDPIQKGVYKGVSVFPFIPSLSYQFKF